MIINLPTDVMLLPDFRATIRETQWVELESWLEQLMRSVEEYFGKARLDFELGTSTHRVLTAVPTTADIDEGQIVFVEISGVQWGYTNIDGTIHGWLLSTEWEKQIEKLEITGRGANAPTARTTETPYLSWTFAENDDSHQSFEIPYDMDYTKSMKIKIHWYTHVDQTGDEVQWEVVWKATAENGSEAINAGGTTVNSGDINCPTQYRILESTIGTIAAGSISQDDIIGFHLERVGIDGGSDPAVGSVHVLSLELEYYANKYGEAT